MASLGRQRATGPQGERVCPISVVESTRRRDDKNYRLSHRDVSGGHAGRIVIKPTRQASAIERVYKRPSLLVGGRHTRWHTTPPGGSGVVVVRAN